MTFSFRTRILGLVLAVGLVPLGVLGLWLTRSTDRAGEELLRVRLVAALDAASVRIGNAWVARRSELLDVSDLEVVRQTLRSARAGAADLTAPPAVRRWMEQRSGLVRRIALRDLSTGPVWSASEDQSRDGMEAMSPPGLSVEVPVRDGPFGPRLGTLVGELSPSAILGSVAPTVAGMVLGAFDSAGVSLLPVPLDPELLDRDRFALSGDEWLVVQRVLRNPEVRLAAAAPLTPFIQPFEGRARQGALLMLGGLFVGLLLAYLLSRRLTGSLEELAIAAEDVSRGDLERTVPGEGPSEVVRVAGAFNTMVESLRRTMAELADRRALAAVGEFAASLAHEIRNPLTSIRVDLQMVEERLPVDDRTTRQIHERALAEIQRLDGTVSGALHAARSGRLHAEAVDVLSAVRAAARVARPSLEEAGAALELPPKGEPPVRVKGDAEALKQLFLNLILNAAQSLDGGGRITVTVERHAGGVEIAVRDEGRGIAAEELDRVFEPFHTTRSGGTGLGLAIARRLVQAHGGEIELDSEPGRGTTVTVLLPGAADAA